MTVQAQVPAVAYTGNGVTTVFAYTFRILDATHLKVFVNGVLQVGGYTVSGVGAQLGGNVTFAAPPGNGLSVLFQRNTAQTQDTDYTPFDPFPAETHETALDKLTMLVQEGLAGSSHAITIPVNESSNTLLPAAGTRANQFVAFDGAGNVIVAVGGAGVPVTAFMATLLDDPTAVAGRATLGLHEGMSTGSIIDAKGDLIVGTANDTPARLAVGANNSAVIADSAATPGVKWVPYPINYLNNQFFMGCNF